MRDFDIICPALALCHSDASRTPDAQGFGWVFEEASLFCAQETLANASMFCDDRSGREPGAFASVFLRWSDPAKAPEKIRPTQEALLGALERNQGDPPSLILIHVQSGAHSKASAADRARRESRNDLIIGLAALHAMGVAFEEIGYAVNKDEPPVADCLRAVRLALERSALDQSAAPALLSAARPGL